MAKEKIADLLVDVLAEAGVVQIYGVSGDSLNRITDSILTLGSGLSIFAATARKTRVAYRVQGSLQGSRGGSSASAKGKIVTSNIDRLRHDLQKDQP